MIAPFKDTLREWPRKLAWTPAAEWLSHLYLSSDGKEMGREHVILIFQIHVLLILQSYIFW